jgi:hypothetical protein
MSATTDAAEVRNIFEGQLSIDKRDSADAGTGVVLLYVRMYFSYVLQFFLLKV